MSKLNRWDRVICLDESSKKSFGTGEIVFRYVDGNYLVKLDTGNICVLRHTQVYSVPVKRVFNEVDPYGEEDWGNE
jgi:hypothetical protein